MASKKHKKESEKDREKGKERERARARKLRQDPVLFGETFFTLKGKPLTFENFPYVRQVFQDKARIVVMPWARSMIKTTTISSILLHKLVTQAYSGVMVAAPRDKQAWRITKEHIRPRVLDSRGGILAPLIGSGKNTESEIDFVNGSKYLQAEPGLLVTRCGAPT